MSIAPSLSWWYGVGLVIPERGVSLGPAPRESRSVN